MKTIVALALAFVCFSVTGIARAAEELDSGRARAKVTQVKAASQRIKADATRDAKAEVA